MKSEPEDTLRQSMEWTERSLPAEVRAIRESITTARQANEELLLAELRMQRERLKRLIRLLSEESGSEELAVTASGPSGSSRYRCRARTSRVD